ncbi:MAG: hypothetical protein GC190_19210 [Alphaproteobacteria bacterium]|nr:hypothetical protein [Alphaproteobacteria bacterium]
MTTETQFPAPAGHNLPPVEPPTPEAALQDLNARYSEIDAALAEYEKAAKTFPDNLTIKDQDVAQALQDLLGKMKKSLSAWGAYKKEEKGKWNGIVKVVQNFFTTREEKLEALHNKYREKHLSFLELKAAEERRAAEAEAERLREIAAAEAAKALAAENERKRAEEERAAAEQRRIEAERRASEERAAKERAEQEAKAARERAAELERQAKERARVERKLLDEKAQDLKLKLAYAKRICALLENDEAEEAEIETLDENIKPNGLISQIAARILSSSEKTEQDEAAVSDATQQVATFRDALSRHRQAEEAERKREQEAEEAERQRIAKEAREKREAELAELEAARAEEAKAKADVEAAKERAAAAKAEQREAASSEKAADRGLRSAERQERSTGQTAAKADARAGRFEGRVDNTEEYKLGTTRGDLGTVGSLTARWTYNIVDEAALRAVSGPLGEHFTLEALQGAVHRWMSSHRGSLTGPVGARVKGLLAGTEFVREIDSRIA